MPKTKKLTYESPVGLSVLASKYGLKKNHKSQFFKCKLVCKSKKAKRRLRIYLSKGIYPGNWHWSYVTKLNIDEISVQSLTC